VRVLDAGRDGERLWYAMEYCAGEDLGARLRRGPLPAAEAARLVARLADAVASAHAQGVVHRDLKPANVILAEPDGRPRITDFGLAQDRAAGGSLTRTGDMLGTPLYMAPEQVRASKHVDHRVDVYALGVILYQCLTGQRPFTGATIPEVTRKVLAGYPLPPRHLAPELPRPLEAACLRAMALDPDDRHATAGELAADLDRALRPRDRPSSLRLRRSGGSPRGLAVAVVVGAVAAGGAVGWWVLTGAPVTPRNGAASEPAPTPGEAPPAGTPVDPGPAPPPADPSPEAPPAAARAAEARRLLARARERSRAKAPFAEVRPDLAEAAAAAIDAGDADLADAVELESAELCFRRGRFEDATALGDALAARRPPGDRIGLQARYVAAFGQLWLDRQDGLDRLRAIWRDDPERPVGLNAGAVWNSYNGDNPKGEVLARRALELDPDYTDPLISLGFCLNDQRRWREALEPIEEAIRRQPDHPRAYMAKAFATGNLQDGQAAWEAYGEVIALTRPTPMPRALRHRARLAVMRGDFAQAVADAEDLLAMLGADREAWFWRGVARERTGDVEGAVADWSQARAADPRGFRQDLARVGREYAERIQALLDERGGR